MSSIRGLRLLLVLLLALGGILALEASGLAQCGMCRAALAGSQNAQFIRSFNIGVLVLLVPPVAMFCSIFAVLKHYGKVERRGSEQSSESDVQER